MSASKALLQCAIATLAFFGGSDRAQAHPHVWVNVQTTVHYEAGQLRGIKHRWTFDDMYTAMAIQGLDKDRDGTYTREELQELAQVNIDGLTEFEYFTFMFLGDQPLKVMTPSDYWLEYTDGILALYFFVPLQEPLLADAPGFSFQVYDPSYFIAFDLAEKEPVTLGQGAPDGCTHDISVPQSDVDLADDLSDAFLSQFGGNFGITLAKTISVKCARS